MFVIIGIVVVIGAILGGYLMEHGRIASHHRRGIRAPCDSRPSPSLFRRNWRSSSRMRETRPPQQRHNGPETRMPSPPPIISEKKVSHGGHHGGAWKVAYADFVTAMMASSSCCG
jgi:MotA/MotB-like proton-channel complex protein